LRSGNDVLEGGMNTLSFAIPTARGTNLFLKWLGRFSKRAAPVIQNGFKSLKAFGSAGKNKAWHHIVEQHDDNISKFGEEAIHNINNLVKLPHGKGSIHSKITGHYNSLMPGTSMRVRDYIKTLSFEEQYNYGLKKLIEFGWKP
jgi:hypothetical protein